MPKPLAELLGGMAIAVVLVDVYLTVLYARSRTGFVARFVLRGGWNLLRRLARPFPRRRRDRILSHGGPVLLMAVVLVWVVVLHLGFALVFLPALGTGIQGTHPFTPDFPTALYYSGFNFTTLGVGDLYPTEDRYRLLTILEAGVGFGMFTLTLTYFMNVFAALVRRNRFALDLHHKSGGRGCPADLVARLGPRDDFVGTRAEMHSMMLAVLDLLESHHSYPVLHYFRFDRPCYAVARVTWLCLGAATLLRCALHPDRHGALMESVSVKGLGESALHLLEETSGVFLPREAAPPEPAAPPERQGVWRRQFHRQLEVLRQAGISVAPDPEAAAEEYVLLRSQWEPAVRALAAFTEYEWHEVAPRDRDEPP